MTQTGLSLSPQAAAAQGPSRLQLLGYRQALLAIAAGVACAAISQLFGRTLHWVWPIPTFGSIAAAFPRAVVLLVLVSRTRRLGVLTTAAAAEIGAKFALGSAVMWPVAIFAPIMGNLAGDALWAVLRDNSRRSAVLALVGAGLCGARILAALVFWSLLRPALADAPHNIGLLLAVILATNVTLGMLAGCVVGQSGKLRKRGSDNVQDE